MPAVDQSTAAADVRKSQTQLNAPALGGRAGSKMNLAGGSRFNLAGGSRLNLAAQQDPQAMLQAAIESGHRVYENNYQLKPSKK